MSLRERKKLETRERIRAAAAELFTRHGYGAATMRQIAKRAHVGLGTLFNYAEDKRDLVFLIFNEELNAVTDVALAEPRPGQALLEQLMAVFRVHYRWLAGKPALARILLQELTFYSSGKQAAIRMVPTDQGLHRQEVTVCEGNDGLVVHAESELARVALYRRDQRLGNLTTLRDPQRGRSLPTPPSRNGCRAAGSHIVLARRSQARRSRG